MTPAQSELERAEWLAGALQSSAPKRRMLVIANPYATTVSDRLKNLVVYALESRYAVEAVDTRERGHAQDLARRAAEQGYDIVVAFGGDGTVNEAASGLTGSDTPLTCLPGGSANVFCRTLGIPRDIVDATEHLLGLADDFRPRRVDTGSVNGQRFLFASGLGLDASVVGRVDAHPRLKSRLRHHYYAWAGVAAFNRQYIVRPPRLRVEAGDRTLEGVTVAVQNSDPYTFFGPRPVRLTPEAGLETGTLAVAVLRRATPLVMPTLVPRLISGRPSAVARARHVDTPPPLARFRVVGEDRPVPLQVDGDYIGEVSEAHYEVHPASLTVVA